MKSAASGPSEPGNRQAEDPGITFSAFSLGDCSPVEYCAAGSARETFESCWREPLAQALTRGGPILHRNRPVALLEMSPLSSLRTVDPPCAISGNHPGVETVGNSVYVQESLCGGLPLSDVRLTPSSVYWWSTPSRGNLHEDKKNLRVPARTVSARL